MTIRRAPRLATVLLERVAECDPSIIGDLTEEYERGRSAWWYRREAALITAAALYRSVRCHPVLLLRAVVTLVLLSNAIIGLLMLHDFSRDLFRIIPGRIVTQFYLWPIAWNLMAFACIAPAAWLMARFHSRVRVPAALAVSVLALISELANPEFHRLLGNMPEWRFVPALVIHVGGTLVGITAMLVGAVVLPGKADSSERAMARP